MTRKNQRLTIIAVVGVALLIATALVLIALRDTVTFFYSPSEVIAAPPPPEQRFRIGGLVVDGSVSKASDTPTVSFNITDNKGTVTITYRGILPDLFREGQGIVATGIYNAANKTFTANQILAKHDENYMPPEVHEALKRNEYK